MKSLNIIASTPTGREALMPKKCGFIFDGKFKVKVIEQKSKRLSFLIFLNVFPFKNLNNAKNHLLKKGKNNEILKILEDFPLKVYLICID